MLTVQCGNDSLAVIMRISSKAVKYIQIAVPILLIVLIVLDLMKVVTGTADDKAKKDALNKAVKRMIYAVIVYLVPTLVSFFVSKMDTFSKNSNDISTITSKSWLSCWNDYYRGSRR